MISEKDYKYGIMILTETYKQVKNDNNVFLSADYWNLAIAYRSLGFDKRIVLDFLDKSKNQNIYKFSYFFISFGGDTNEWEGYLIDSEYDSLYNDCMEVLINNPKLIENIHLSDAKGVISFGQKFVSGINQISYDDTKHSTPLNIDDLLQRRLEFSNQKKKDYLINKHKK